MKPRRPGRKLQLRSRAPYGARGLKPWLMKGQEIEGEPRPVRGAWVETSASSGCHSGARGRAPYGARGLKRRHPSCFFRVWMPRPVRGAWVETGFLLSCPSTSRRPRPVRGAWVETLLAHLGSSFIVGRAPYGARGLKPFYPNLMNDPGGRAPYGARGLKRWRRERGVRRDKAAPRTGRVG